MVLDLIGAAITYLAVAVAAWFLAPYLAAVFTGQRVFLSPVLGPLERGAYRLMGVDEGEEHSWVRYAVAVLAVTLVSLVFSYLVMRFQDRLPHLNQGADLPLPGDTTSELIRRLSGIDVHILRRGLGAA